MTYIVVTDTLIENLDNLDIDELKYEKIKSNEFSSNTNVSLFSDDLYKFVTDEFFTFKKLLLFGSSLLIDEYIVTPK